MWRREEGREGEKKRGWEQCYTQQACLPGKGEGTMLLNTHLAGWVCSACPTNCTVSGLTRGQAGVQRVTHGVDVDVRDVHKHAQSVHLPHHTLDGRERGSMEGGREDGWREGEMDRGREGGRGL